MGCLKLDISKNHEPLLRVVEKFSKPKKMVVNCYPFGSVMPGRNASSADYRYGFNGKEQSNSFGNASGAIYDYGFRIYDARIGRFLSVDPLFQSYPYYTPYQFAGNKPIWAIDLDGLEESETNEGTEEEDAKADIKMIFENAGGAELFEQLPPYNDLGGFGENPQPGSKILGTKSSGRYTNANHFFYANDKVTPEIFVNLLLGSLIQGIGPENWVFSEDSEVSKVMMGANILDDALELWYEENAEAIVLKNKNGIEGGKYEISYGENQIQDLLKDGTFLTVPNFVGSASITITPDADDMMLNITIVNVTSLASGSLTKHGWGNDAPQSIPREESSCPNCPAEPYSNNSQTFQIKQKISYGEALWDFIDF